MKTTRGLPSPASIRFFEGFPGTPTAFQSTSPGLRRRRYPGCERGGNNPIGVASKHTNPCCRPGGCSPFRVVGHLALDPRVARSRNPGRNDGTPMAFYLTADSCSEFRAEPSIARQRLECGAFPRFRARLTIQSRGMPRTPNASRIPDVTEELTARAEEPDLSSLCPEN